MAIYLEYGRTGFYKRNIDGNSFRFVIYRMKSRFERKPPTNATSVYVLFF